MYTKSIDVDDKGERAANFCETLLVNADQKGLVRRTIL